MQRALPLYLASLVLFGLNGITASHIDLSAIEIVLMRLVCGLAFLLPFAARPLIALPLRGRALAASLAAGSVMGVSWILLYDGFQLIGVAESTILYYVGPVIVMAAAAIFGRERFSALQWGGLTLAFAGLTLVIGADASLVSNVRGLSEAIASAFCYAGMIYFVKASGARPEQSIAQTFLILAAGLAVVVASFFVLGVGFPSVGELKAFALPLFLLGFINTGFGCLLYFRTVPLLPVATVSILSYVEPLTAVIAAAIVLGEPVGLWQAIGIAMLFSGAAAAQLASPKKA